VKEMISKNDLEVFYNQVREILTDTLLSFEERVLNCQSIYDNFSEEGFDNGVTIYNEYNCDLPLVTIIETTVENFIKELKSTDLLDIDEDI